MSTIVLRSVKGSPLTNAEVDSNFTNLNNDKTELGGTYSAGTANGVLFLSASKVLTTGSALTFDGTKLGMGGAGVASEVSIGMVTTTGNSTFGTYFGGGYGSLTSGDAYIYTAKNIVLMTDNAASSIKFSAGGSAEQMRLTSTGLGIGTSSPAYKLQVAGTGAFSNSGNENLFLIDTTGGRSSLQITGPINYFNANIDSASHGQYIWRSSNAYTERMRLDASGNLGIGTSSPSQTLNVKGIGLFEGTAQGNVIIQKTGTNGVSLFSDAAGKLGFYDQNAGVTRLTLDSSGNLGLGVTPSAWGSAYRSLDVATGGAGFAGSTYASYLTTNAYNDGTAWKFKDGAFKAAMYNSFDGAHMWSVSTATPTANGATSFSQAMTLDASGNLGVGTTSPAQKLHVASDGYNFRTSNAGNSAGYNIGRNTTDGLLYFYGDQSGANGYVFSGVDGERARIDSSGNLGLGVTPSAWTTSFSVRALQFGGGSVYSYDNDRVFIGQNVAITGTGSDTYINTAAASTYRQFQGAHVWYNAPSGTAGNAISFTQAMTLDASGNLGIGTTSPSAGLHVNKASGEASIKITSVDTAGVQQSIYFGATSFNRAAIKSLNANTFDGNLQFFTGNSSTFDERARITSGGALLVNRTAAGGSELFNVTGGASGTELVRFYADHATNPYGQSILYPNANPNNTGNEYLICASLSGGVTIHAGIRSNGGIANYSANDVNLSDRREKTNFAPAKSYLDTICAIPVQTFNYIDQNNEEDPGLTLGVVAQDVQTVAPELVMESNWGSKDDPKMRLSIYQTDLQYALMKCIQEQQVIINSLKARLDAANI
jgi:hypothetical protein